MVAAVPPSYRPLVFQGNHCVTSPEQFQQQAADGHTRIPVVREVLSDLDTPLSVYLKLADGPHTYLFESVEGGERFGRYSIIGLPARRVYAFAGHTLFVTEDGELVESRDVDDPFAEVERLRAAHTRAEDPGPARLHRRPGRLVRLRVHRVHRAAPAPATATSPTNSARPTSC